MIEFTDLLTMIFFVVKIFVMTIAGLLIIGITSYTISRMASLAYFITKAEHAAKTENLGELKS